MMWVAKQKSRMVHSHPLLLPSFRSLLLVCHLHPFSSPPSTVCRRPPPTPPPEEGRPHFMVDYLVGACGLSMAEAGKASRYLAHLNSLEKPDAVLRLMKQEGLGDAQIRHLVVVHPTVLAADTKKTLEPKIRALLTAGLSRPELARLISSSGLDIPLHSVPRRVEFWRNLLGSNQNLLRAIGSNPCLLSVRVERVDATLSLLRSLGTSDEMFGRIMVRSPYLLSSNLERIRVLVEQVKSLGISPGSAKFALALSNVSNISRATFDAKLQLLKSFGWSQAELVLALQRFPSILNISPEKIKTIMDFLLKEARCNLSYIAKRPVLLAFSKQRRLMPRLRVLQSLKMKGLPGADHDLYNVMLLPEKKFVDKYIAPNSEKAPKVLEAYLAATAKSI